MKLPDITLRIARVVKDIRETSLVLFEIVLILYRQGIHIPKHAIFVGVLPGEKHRAIRTANRPIADRIGKDKTLLRERVQNRSNHRVLPHESDCL